MVPNNNSNNHVAVTGVRRLMRGLATLPKVIGSL